MLSKRKRRTLLSRISLAVLALWVSLALWQAPVVRTITSNNVQGVWITHTGAAMMYYTMRLDEVIANLAKHHVNTLYPAVWNRGYTLYPSHVAQSAGGKSRDWSTDIPGLPGDNILKALTHQAHRQHIKLIPWFEYGLMIPLSSPIAKAHPDWLTVNLEQQTVPKPLTPAPFLPRPLKNLQLEVTGGNLAWLNPFHPEVQTFLTNLIAEVVQDYAVDGIQLDDHFGLPIEMGYDPYTIALYKSEHKDLGPPNNAADPEWIAWRAKRITQLLDKISQAVKNVDPKVMISISPNPPRFAYLKYLQDWVTWVESGLVNEVVVQVYRENFDTFQNDLYHSGFYHLRHKVPIIIGLYTGPLRHAKPLERIQKEVESVQAAGFQGVSFFSWETTLWLFKQGDTQQIQQSFNQLFSAKT